jgi:hypothetical protein
MKLNIYFILLGFFYTSACYAGLIISESDADQSGIDNAEFIELYDGGLGTTSLDGYSLVLFNGSDDRSYLAFDLDGYTTNSAGYFVICGDGNNVVNCDLDVSPSINLIQNGADAIALYQGDALDFPNDTDITPSGLVDSLVYDTNDGNDAGLAALLIAGRSQFNEDENGNRESHSIQLCDSYIAAMPTPGTVNSCDIVPDHEVTLGACGESSQTEFQLISSIQGDVVDIKLDASLLLGQQVIVEGIVTTDLQGGQLANGDESFQYNGYWLQEEIQDSDGNSNTSEGIFVYDFKSDVSIGDKVRLAARVEEFNQVTQLKSVTELLVCSTGNTLPVAVELILPVTSLTELEAHEGMLISNNQNLIVSDLHGTGYGLGNYGQFVVSSKLHFQPTEIAPPNSLAAKAALDARPLDTLLIDDGVSKSYPTFIPFPDVAGFSVDNPMRIGYRIPSVQGVMNAFGENYTLIPSAITIDPDMPRTLVPKIAESANLVIAGMNVLNYFNGDGLGEGFPTARGARTAEAFAMQNDKIVAALQAIDADIIGLMEIENDGFGESSAIQTLVNELNLEQVEGGEYSFVNPFIAGSADKIGNDAISVGVLYRAEKVALVGDTIILDSTNSPQDENGQALFVDSKNRPSLIQSFSFNDQQFTLSVNHLKSKGSSCNEPNEGDDGQANCNIMRTKAAQGLAQFLATNPTGVDSNMVMILGDLNAYSQEDPMQVFYANDFINLKYTDKASEVQPYSYSFSGFLGSLDHALVTDDLLPYVVSVDAWHINSVEDSLMDYQTEGNGQRYPSVDNYAAADAYRSSDHDPIVIGLAIFADDSEVQPAPDSQPGPELSHELPVEDESSSPKGGPLSPLILLLVLVLAGASRSKQNS